MAKSGQRPLRRPDASIPLNIGASDRFGSQIRIGIAIGIFRWGDFKGSSRSCLHNGVMPIQAARVGMAVHRRLPMSEFMLILSGREKPMWPPLSSSTDPETILLRMVACLRDLDRIDARLAAAYLESAIHHLRIQFNLDDDSTKSD